MRRAVWLATIPLGGYAIAQVLGRRAGATGPSGISRCPAGPRSGPVTWRAWACWPGIVVQLLVLRRFCFLQPVIAVLGLAETGLAWLWRRTEGRRSGRNRDLRP